jgi:hypothetical protein
MNQGFLNKLFIELKHDNQCLLYNGSYSNDLMIKIIGLSEANQKQHKVELQTQRRVSYLMAECFQNIMKHGEKETDNENMPAGTSFFMNRNSKGTHYILSANLIQNENIEGLKDQIDAINKLSGVELKELYVKTMKEGKFSDKGGAGLGLIDMARKSGHKLDYIFVDFNEKASVFYNQIVLKITSDTDEILPHELKGIEPGIDFHKMLVAEGALMVQKGDFSQDSMLPVLNIIEKSFIDPGKKMSLSKNIYIVMVELLQNISKHTNSENGLRDGIFSLALKEGHYVVSTGNNIPETEVELIKVHIDHINKLNADELEDLYTETLMNNIDDEDECAGLGIITMRQIATQPIAYAFDKTDDGFVFFSIHVTI